jgi:hypothetical protein
MAKANLREFPDPEKQPLLLSEFSGVSEISSHNTRLSEDYGNLTSPTCAFCTGNTIIEEHTATSF